MHLFDFAGAVVFLLALIAISRFRKYITAQDREAYNHVVTGLVILAAVSLSKIYSDSGLFGQTPFVSEPLFFKLLFWIGMITGLVFLISGVTNWVPLSRSYRKYNQERIQKLEFIKKVEQLLRVERRLPVVLNNALGHMIASYDLNGGAVYMYSRKRGDVICIGSSGTDEAAGLMKAVTFDGDAIKNFPQDQHQNPQTLITDLPSGLSMPELAIPVVTGDYLIGFFLLWTKQAVPIDDEDRINLKIAGDIIGHEVCHEFLQLKHDFHRELDLWTSDLNLKMDYRRGAQQNVTAVFDSLRRNANADYISLVVVKDDGMAVRFTAGETGGLLTETNVNFERSTSVVKTVYHEDEPLYIGDLGEQPAIEVDNMLDRNRYRSLAVLPIKHGSHTEGVVTVAAKKPYAIGREQQRFIESAMPAMGSIACSERHRFAMRRNERRGFILNNLLSRIVELENTEDVFDIAATVIKAELRPAVVRISSVDNKRAFMESLALQMAESTTAMLTPARGSMILSLMPYHQLVLETGRLMMINQQSTDRRMTEAESKQVFGIKLNSALLVPVKIGSAAVGVISLADQREWHKYQFKQDDIQFVTAVSSILSVALRLVRSANESTATLPRKVGKFDPEAYAQARARGRIKSSLTGILGSVEFLKNHRQPTENDLHKCLAIIDKSARRIGEYVTTDDGK